jgi:hypothetical protein
MTWKKRIQPIKVGDKVAYSKSFLQSTGSYSGDIPHARGEVTTLIPIGETTLAEIAWDRPDMPARVNVKNLVSVKRIAYE